MAYSYHYKKNRGRPSVSAGVVGAELDRIRVENGGRLVPADVVRESKPDGAPLHPCFEWKDRVAANAWREHQARNIINVVVIREVKEDSSAAVEAQAFVNIVRGEQQSYESIVNVMSDDDARAQLVQRYLERLVHMQREFRNLREFSRVCEAIDDLALQFAVKP